MPGFSDTCEVDFDLYSEDNCSSLYGRGSKSAAKLFIPQVGSCHFFQREIILFCCNKEEFNYFNDSLMIPKIEPYHKNKTIMITDTSDPTSTHGF